MVQLPIGIATHLLIINIGLQVVDGVLTYYGLQLGFQEGNPLVRTAMDFWGVEWGLLFWKGLACALLGLMYCLRESVNVIPGLALTASVYIMLSVFPWMTLLLAQTFQRLGHHESSLFIKLFAVRNEFRWGVAAG